MPPLISVVLPVWNGESYLAAAIDSILAQSFRDFELVVIDDGSTDGTTDILHSYTDSRLRIHRREHGGIVAALNYGVEQSNADWIARQDADDISMPDRLEVQFELVNKIQNIVLSYSDSELIGEVSEGMGNARLPRTKAFTALKLCFQCPIIHSTVLFRKNAFHKAGGYLPEERHAEDFSLWGRMVECGECAGVPKKLLQRRVHSNSVSRQNLDTQLALTRRIAVEHCRRYMRLNDDEARRAFAVLDTSPTERTWSEWGWFLVRCYPRMQWKSLEAVAWLARQTLYIRRSLSAPRRITPSTL